MNSILTAIFRSVSDNNLSTYLFGNMLMNNIYSIISIKMNWLMRDMSEKYLKMIFLPFKDNQFRLLYLEGHLHFYWFYRLRITQTHHFPNYFRHLVAHHGRK